MRITPFAPFRKLSMTTKSRSPLLALGLAALFLLPSALSLSGCAQNDEVYADDYAPALALDIAPVPPPALSDEYREPVTDPRTQVWRPGHWSYQDQRFVWVPGEMLTRPSPTAVWSADRWERRAYGWVFLHGYWQ